MTAHGHARASDRSDPRLQPIRTRGGLCVLALAALAGITAAGCASTPEVPLPAPLPESFSADGVAPRLDHWWLALDDPPLALLVEEALAESPDLATVRDRLAQARAVARREGAALGPTLDLQTGANATWFEQKAASASVPFGGRGSGIRRDDQFRLGLAFAWEIDLFGRLRATREAARYDALAREAELQASAILLSAQVASQWYFAVEQARQLALLDAQIENNEEVLRLVTIRFRTGQVGAADVLRQRQLVEQRRGQRHLVEAQAQVARHALAVLIGRSPRTPVLPAAARLPEPGPLPETGLPAELLTRRPDVQSAYLGVVAADRRLAAARADRLPRLSLAATPAFSAETLSQLVDNWVAVLAANLVTPLIDSGRRRAEVDRTRALVSERIHAYGQTVLVSLREVEDALVREQQQRELIESLESQLALARQTLERLRDRYLKGATDYLDVLGALSSRQELERSLVTARRQLLDYRVALHRALAGGFALEPAPLAELGGAPERDREARTTLELGGASGATP